MSLSTGTVSPSYVELQGADGLLLKMPLCRVGRTLYLCRLSILSTRQELLTVSNLAKALLECNGLVSGEDEEGQCI